MRKVKISSLANVMGVFLLVGFFAIIGLAYYSIEKLKIGGPYYVRMMNGKDLIADVLPPPLYIIEPFLEASHLVMEPSTLTEHRKLLNELHKAYDVQRKRWLDEQIIDPAVRDAVTETAHTHAAVFWDVLEKQLYPAVEKGDDKAIKEAFHALEAAYDTQRKSIDKAVETATAMTDKISAEALQAEHQTLAMVAAVGALVLLIVIGSIAGVIFGIVRPINLMKAIMQQLARGDRAVAIPYSERHDEIGEMAQTVEVFKNNLLETERMREAQEAAELHAGEERTRQRIELADGFEHAVGAIVQAVASASAQLDATAESLTHTARETSTQSNTVASASHAASSNVQAVASAAEELSGSIREITTQVHHSSSMANKASEEAVRTTGQMDALAEAAKHIGGIIELINQIASQTNLLALNATIEAARAGESGRGFAVVSQEVKQLAERTAKATGEIASQITSIQNFITEAAQCINGITGTISTLNDVSAAIATAVEEQGAVTQEIARNIHHASAGTNEVTRNIEAVQESAESSSAAATQVLNAARDLAKQSNVLQYEVGNFLERVRAA